MVGATGFEPATSWSQTTRSTKLSYAPNEFIPQLVTTYWPRFFRLANPDFDWKKVGPCLYRYKEGIYYALLKDKGKQFRRYFKPATPLLPVETSRVFAATSKRPTRFLAAANSSQARDRICRVAFAFFLARFRPWRAFIGRARSFSENHRRTLQRGRLIANVTNATMIVR